MPFDPNRLAEANKPKFDPGRLSGAKPAEPKPVVEKKEEAPVLGFQREYRTPQGRQELAKAGARGMIKSPGFVGDIAEMIAGKPVPYLPTSEDISKFFKLQETPKKYKGAEEAGGLVAGMLTPIVPYGARGAARAVRGAIAPEASLSARVAEPVGTTTLGKDVISKVTDRLKSLRAGRSEEAKALFENFYRDAAPVENYIREGYVNDLTEYLIKNQGRLAPEEESVLRDAVRRVGSDAKIEALDKERRILKESIDPSATGGDAIKNEAYKLAHDLLLKNITSRVKTAEETYARYADLSKEINQFGTALGKKLTTPAGEFLPEIPKVDPKDVPASVFKSEGSVDALKRLSGDAAFVNDAARKHIANELTGDLTPAKVNKYILDNEWLSQVPEVKAELQGLSSELSSGKKLRYGAYIGGAGLLGTNILNKIGKFFGD